MNNPNESNPTRVNTDAPEGARPRRPRKRGKMPTAADRVDYVDAPPENAWAALGFKSRGALWAHLRRHEVGDSVDLGGGAVAYRRGRRWIVRMPRTNPLKPSC